VREGLDACGDLPARFAAFGARADMADTFSGWAAATIEKRSKKLGGLRVTKSASFLVDKKSALNTGQCACSAYARDTDPRSSPVNLPSLPGVDLTSARVPASARSAGR
jgi:hypothetical protein